jgi:hypothetical protein
MIFDPFIFFILGIAFAAEISQNSKYGENLSLPYVQRLAFLPDNVKPIGYELDIKVDMENFTFEGKVEIR